MGAEDLRVKSTEELAEELLGLRREQFNLRMQRGTGELARHSEYGRVKKDIARVKTVMSELRLAAKTQETKSGKSE
jgi:large subunit ribosomal protein L29